MLALGFSGRGVASPVTATATWSVRPSRSVSRGDIAGKFRVRRLPGMLPPQRRGFGGRQVVRESPCYSLYRPPCCRKRINRAGQLAAGNAAEAGTRGLTRAPGRTSGPAPPAPAAGPGSVRGQGGRYGKEFVSDCVGSRPPDRDNDPVGSTRAAISGCGERRAAMKLLVDPLPASSGHKRDLCGMQGVRSDSNPDALIT
jgi:hypothetical protein